MANALLVLVFVACDDVPSELLRVARGLEYAAKI